MRRSIAVAVAGGCGGAETRDRPRDALPTAPAGNFVLYVSNQSFDRPRVDIEIEIDGRVAVDDEFDVGDQHSWVEFRFRLEQGRHTLRAASEAGEAEGVWSFRITGRNWAVVDYWYYPGERKRFSFDVSDEPIAFA